MMLTLLALSLLAAPPPPSPPVVHDWRPIGGFEFEHTQRLTWPGLYQLQLLGRPERRVLTRFSVRRTRGFADFSVVSVSRSFADQLPGRETGSVKPAKGAIWGEVAVRLPKLPGRVGSRFLFRGGQARPNQVFLSGRF